MCVTIQMKSIAEQYFHAVLDYYAEKGIYIVPTFTESVDETLLCDYAFN